MANKEFKPTSNVSRSEAYAMLMASVCMKPTTKNTDWQKNIWQAARTYGLTTRELADFAPNAPILTQELFALAAKTADWAEQTGGCNPRPAACLTEYNKTIKNAVIPIIVVPAPAVKQTPGTFVFLYDNATEEVYSYTLKVGEKISGIRTQFNTLVNKAVVAKDISIRDATDRVYTEIESISAGVTVTVHVTKPAPVAPAVAILPVIDLTLMAAFEPSIGTDTLTIFAYTLQIGGTAAGVREKYRKAFNVSDADMKKVSIHDASGAIFSE